MSEREYVGDRPVVIGTAEKPVMLGFTDAEIERLRAHEEGPEKSHPYGTRKHVECVNTRALRPGDWIWHGQGWACVRDTKLESELDGRGFRSEDQCAVLWRDLPNAERYDKKGYTIFGDVVLRVIP